MKLFTLFSLFVAFYLSLFINTTKSDTIVAGDELDGRFIYLQNEMNPDYWITVKDQDNIDDKEIVIQEQQDIREVASKDQVRFQLVHQVDGWYTIESQRHFGYYISTSLVDSKWVSEKREYTPSGFRQHWKIHYFPDNRTVGFQPRYPNPENKWLRTSLDIHTAQLRLTLEETSTPPVDSEWHKWILHQDLPVSNLVVVATVKNGDNIEAQYDLTVEIGIARENALAKELSISVSSEIAGMFASASAEFSSTWSQSSTETFSEVQSETISITLGEGTYQVLQLQGTVRGYRVKSNYWEIRRITPTTPPTVPVPPSWIPIH